jgi:hypothetical protein
VKRIVFLIAALVIGGVFYVFWDLRQSEGDALMICGKARVGMPVADYLDAVPADNFRIIRGQGSIIIVPRKGMGRHNCVVSHDGLKITDAKKRFLD